MSTILLQVVEHYKVVYYQMWAMNQQIQLYFYKLRQQVLECFLSVLFHSDGTDFVRKISTDSG